MYSPIHASRCASVVVAVCLCTLSNVDVAINTLKRQVLMLRDTNRNKSSERRKLRGSRERIGLARVVLQVCSCTCIPHSRVAFVDHPLKGKRFANRSNKIIAVVESNNYSVSSLSLPSAASVHHSVPRLSSPLHCLFLRDVSIALPTS